VTDPGLPLDAVTNGLLMARQSWAGAAASFCFTGVADVQLSTAPPQYLAVGGSCSLALAVRVAVMVAVIDCQLQRCRCSTGRDGMHVGVGGHSPGADDDPFVGADAGRGELDTAPLLQG